MQVEGIESMLTQQAYRFRPETLVPIALVTDVDAKLCEMVTVIKAEQSTGANQFPLFSTLLCDLICPQTFTLTLCADFDSQSVLVSWAFEHLIEPTVLFSLRIR